MSRVLDLLELPRHHHPGKLPLTTQNVQQSPCGFHFVSTSCAAVVTTSTLTTSQYNLVVVMSCYVHVSHWHPCQQPWLGVRSFGSGHDHLYDARIRQAVGDTAKFQVLVLGCEHAAPLPDDSLESLVQLCRSLSMPQQWCCFGLRTRHTFA